MKEYPTISLTKILTYPLDLSPLFIIFCTSMFISYALMGALMAIIVASGLSIFFLWYMKYAFSILIHTAEGYTETPIFGDSYIRPFEDYRPFKFGVILLVHIFVMSTFYIIYSPLYYLYGVLVLAFLPAIISQLAMENKLFKTFNIKVLFEIIKASGEIYWLSFSFYLVTFALIFTVYRSDIWLFFAVFITLYFIFVSFHVIGLTLYTRREQMGYATTYSPEQVQKEIDDEKLKKYQRISGNVYSQHRQPTSLLYLERELINEPTEVYEWFYNEIMTWKIKPKFKRLFIQLYCRKLCESGEGIKALELVTHNMNTDNELIIDDNPTCSCILKEAIQAKDIQSINTFSSILLKDKNDLEYRKKTLMVMLHYYIEVNVDNDMAHELLTTLTTEFPEIHSNKMIEQYRAVLEQN